LTFGRQSRSGRGRQTLVQNQANEKAIEEILVGFSGGHDPCKRGCEELRRTKLMDQKRTISTTSQVTKDVYGFNIP
jgi:hypothetical protein